MSDLYGLRKRKMLDSQDHGFYDHYLTAITSECKCRMSMQFKIAYCYSESRRRFQPRELLNQFRNYKIPNFIIFKLVGQVWWDLGASAMVCYNQRCDATAKQFCSSMILRVSVNCKLHTPFELAQ